MYGDAADVGALQHISGAGALAVPDDDNGLGVAKHGGVAPRARGVAIGVPLLGGDREAANRDAALSRPEVGEGVDAGGVAVDEGRDVESAALEDRGHELVVADPAATRDDDVHGNSSSSPGSV